MVKIGRAALAKRIDHTFLRPDARPADIIRLCREAKEYGFWSVCVPSYYVSLAAKHVNGSRVRVTAVVGFPFGYSTPTAKMAEAEFAIASGADEIDMVMNVAAFKAGNRDYAATEIAAMAGLCKESGKILKVIIECCYLTTREKVAAAKMVERSGAQFVKTSTGYGPSGAIVSDVKLLKRSVSRKVKVKAAGGINTLEKALEMVDAGADRIGASHSVKIMGEF